MADGRWREWGVKDSGQVKGLEERSLTTPGLVFHFIPINFCLWLKWHGLKAKKENVCPIIPVGLGRTRQQPCGVTRADCGFV